MGLRFDVVAPRDGSIERVMLREGEKIEEGTPIFSLQSNGVNCEILAPVTGITESLEVEQGDITISGMILAVIVQR
ncbi:hypothetical protein EDM56_07130 [Brevibacillus fluminis]|uniref:Lipoyl-binding domain-containing protein n=1 Tax=Brevibacillus fluminis TaxID=511487 RepID=A0A3M8DS48_9BACL|nr:biotin/lipoyl-containing protein [Brevibacillus fluminis]RNB90281.1 hypothetical protein EDM56_07130 [Brevibacillus fluminis]